MDHVLSVGLLAVLHETVCEEVEGRVEGGGMLWTGNPLGGGSAAGAGAGWAVNAEGPAGGEVRSRMAEKPEAAAASCHVAEVAKRRTAARGRTDIGGSLERISRGELGEAATKESRRRTEKKHLK